jgi:hypothetical protein
MQGGAALELFEVCTLDIHRVISQPIANWYVARLLWKWVLEVIGIKPASLPLP